MPGSVSDSYDPEYGTADNCEAIGDAMIEICDKLGEFLGERQNIIQTVHGKGGPLRAVTLTERQWRVIRFGLERANKTI